MAQTPTLTSTSADMTEARGPVTRYVVALGMMALAVLLRWLLDPWLGTNLGFLTVYGAVPCAVWFSGWRPAVLASVLGFLACVYWFVPPRGVFDFHSPYVWGASIGYLISSFLIIFLGQTARSARRHAERQSQRLARELQENTRLYEEAQREIAARKEVETALLAAKERADAANAAKDRFLAMISHELRTPFTPALMLAGMHAQETALPEDVRQDFETIRRSLTLEALLIDDLLDVTRIIQGRLRLNKGLHDIHPILRRAWEIIRPDLEDTSLKVDFHLHPQDLRVPCDSLRLQKVLWNLLRNAAQHSPTGGIITVSTHRGAGTVQLRVSDTGSGIPRNELETIFEPFEQSADLRPGTRAKPAGLGIGLAISRGIITAHNGKIWAESEGPGKGATFIVELPAE